MLIKTYKRDFKYFLISLVIILLILIFKINLEQEVIAKKVKGVKIPVLMYHEISDNHKNNDMVVSKEKFEEDIKTLNTNGYKGVFLEDIESYLKGEIELPKKPIVITFDDGYESNFDTAYPILSREKMKATINVIGKDVGIDHKTSLPHFSWEEAREMKKSKYIDIQCHTYNLHDTVNLKMIGKEKYGIGMLPFYGESKKEHKDRFLKDLEIFEGISLEEMGYKTKFIAYPYGQYNIETERMLSELGFVGSMTSNEGIRNFKELNDLKEIPRLNVNEALRKDKLIRKVEKLAEM